MNESGELVFLRYAFPAAECCSHGKLSKQERLEFIRMLKEGGTPNKERLEELFPNAIKHLRSWDEKDVRDYWCLEHNKIVADNPVCKVYGLRAIKVGLSNGEKDYRVSASGISAELLSYVPLIIGDYFTAHNLIVAEKITPQKYSEYFDKKR